jgi:4-hydroxybenzoate polyprenyltransferase
MASYSYDGTLIFPNDGFSFRNWIVQKISELGQFVLYSSLFLGAAAVGMAYTSCFIQNIEFTIPLAAVLSMIVFSVYNLNRKTDEAEDALNHEQRFSITKRFEKQFFIAAIIAYVVALIVSASQGIAAFAVVTIPFVSGIFYSMPILPRSWGYRRLKEIPLMKNLVVSTAWAISFSLVPVYMTGSVPGIPTLIVFLFIFAWTFVGSVLPDIRDRTGDSAIGVATIPVLIGVPKSRILLTIINLSVGATILLLGRSVLPRAGTVIACSIIYSQVYHRSIDCR